MAYNIAQYLNYLFYTVILGTPHIQIIVRSLSRAVNFKHRFNHKDQRGFPNASQRSAPIGRWVKQTDIPFEHGILLHFGWYINTPSHYKDTGVRILPNSVAGEGFQDKKKWNG